ncbi:acyl-CoA dehydrogenase [Gordonia sp. SID5947]|uniref:acyl-CoA dehydrogenase family protein n=1 Tax=Gordonia sp. SID5947 TaxID=2690315 RepID=UPI001368983D|nr:acyl-CoA dehydrogenase family protein [Gordonia sp. SID5947]MYR06394.1 acyl-CoA dehydrogenase [Gordonia sp. SID5947]
MSNRVDDLTEFHGELSAVARDILSTRSSGAQVDWALIAGSGWLGLEVPACEDGAGASFAEVSVVLREMGRVVAAGPYPAVAGLAVGALGAVEPCDSRDRLLRQTVAGDAVPILVLDGAEPDGGHFRLIDSDRGLVLQGRAEFVLGAPDADRLLVPAITSAGTVVMVGLDPRAEGLTVEPRPVVDATRTFGRVSAAQVHIDDGAVWRLPDGAGAMTLLRDRAAATVVCDNLGLTEAMLEKTVAYAGIREQFGRKIGSFQAVKHACADMLVELTVARKLVDAAILQVRDGTPGESVAVDMAASFTGEMAVRVAGKAMQLHGGMGYTWESDVHVYLKRATMNRTLFGSPARHRARIARRYRA